MHTNAINVLTVQYTKSLSENSVRLIRSTKNNKIWHENHQIIKNGKIDSILDPVIKRIEYKTKFTIKAKANLDTSVAYQTLLSKNVLIKNNEIPNRYPIHKETSEDVNIHQKKNKSRKISNHILKISKKRLNRIGLFSSRS